MNSFALRLPDHILEQAKAPSSEDQISINQLLVSFISEGLGHRRGLKMMEERAARADINFALKIPDGSVPDVPLDAGDEFEEDAFPSPAWGPAEKEMLMSSIGKKPAKEAPTKKPVAGARRKSA